MALNPSNSSNLEQLALKGLMHGRPNIQGTCTYLEFFETETSVGAF